MIWHLSTDQAAKAVEWRDSLGALKNNWLGGPALLSADFQFRFKALGEDRELPCQDSRWYLGQAYDGYGGVLGESCGKLSLSSRSTLSVVFFLPFEEPNPELWDYVAFLQRWLPFSFSAKHWKHWKLTKKGTAYVGTRIKNPVLGPRNSAVQPTRTAASSS
jgi:hypothetical protein